MRHQTVIHRFAHTPAPRPLWHLWIIFVMSILVALGALVSLVRQIEREAQRGPQPIPTDRPQDDQQYVRRTDGRK